MCGFEIGGLPSADRVVALRVWLGMGVGLWPESSGTPVPGFRKDHCSVPETFMF